MCEKLIIKEYWWEGGDLIFLTDKNEKIRLECAYPTDIGFAGIDYETNEMVEIYCGTQYERKNNS